MADSDLGAPVRLVTERFEVRSLVPEDASERYAGWLADPEIVHHLEVSAGDAPSVDELRGFIAGHDNFGSYLLGVFTRDGEHIGNFRFRLARRHGVAYFGVMIGERDYWGQGVVLECRASILDYIFRVLDVYKAVGAATSRNMPALFNYGRQGWQQEGVQRGEYLEDGQRVDKVWFAMFREDWLKRSADSD